MVRMRSSVVVFYYSRSFEGRFWIFACEQDFELCLSERVRKPASGLRAWR